jgi:DNA end-binding protein Ku
MWTGFLSFGLVNIPIGLHSATVDQGVHFNQFEKGTSDRIRYKKVNERTGEEVPNDAIVRGVDLGNGEYAIVSSEELKAAAPGHSDSIEIQDFVDLDEIDPIYFRQTYYLAPRGKGADRAYALLRQAMRETNKVGVATFVMRDKEYLVAVRPADEVLMLETMYFADEVRDPGEELDSLPGTEVSFEGRELEIAKQLVDSLSTKWEPSQYHNSYRARVEELIEQKRAGQTVVVDVEKPRSNVVNLMEALQASLERNRERALAEANDSPEQAETPKKKAVSGNEQQSFEGMTKSALLARAAELEVQGRSKMSRDELIDAVRAASEPPRRARKVS